MLDANVGGSLAYLISRESDPKLQTMLVDRVIDEHWTRKQIEAFYRSKQSVLSRLEYQSGPTSIRVELPKHATPTQLLEALRAFATTVNKSKHYSLETLASLLREQNNAV